KIVFTLASANDLAIPLGGNEITAEAVSRIFRIRLHIKGLNSRRKMVNEHGLILPFADGGFVRRSKVITNNEAWVGFFSNCRSFLVMQSRERGLNSFKL